MDKLNAEETLNCLIGVIVDNLTELYEPLLRGNAQFIRGEKTAYVECLEIMQHWEKAEENGLCGNIEKRYPI